MPSRKEQRQQVKRLANIGVANIRMRQVWIRKDVEFKKLLIAAMDTASVQVAFLIGLPPIDNALGHLDTALQQITPEQATAGIQLLGWRRLVGTSFQGVHSSLVHPEIWAEAVGAPDLLGTFILMAQTWWEAIEAREADPKAQNPSFQRFVADTWDGLEQRMYGKPSRELDPMHHLLVSNRLTWLTTQTERYYWAKVNSEPMPLSQSGSLTWFMEEFLAVSPPGGGD